MIGPKHTSAVGLTKQELAYVAGYFDGEGCVMHSGGSIRVAISNTFLPRLKWLMHSYGGSIRECETPRGLGFRRLYQWQISGKNARRFLLDIEPLLDEKREQAQIVLQLGELPVSERLPYLVRLAALKRINHGEATPRHTPDRRRRSDLARRKRRPV